MRAQGNTVWGQRWSHSVVKPALSPSVHMSPFSSCVTKLITKKNKVLTHAKGVIEYELMGSKRANIVVDLTKEDSIKKFENNILKSS